MRFALLALLLSVVTVAARAGDEMPSVLTNPPTAETTTAPAVQVVCADEVVVASSTKTRCRSRCCGLVRRAARGTVEVSRTVVRTVTRPIGRVCTAFGCR